MRGEASRRGAAPRQYRTATRTEGIVDLHQRRVQRHVQPLQPQHVAVGRETRPQGRQKKKPACSSASHRTGVPGWYNGSSTYTASSCKPARTFCRRYTRYWILITSSAAMA